MTEAQQQRRATWGEYRVGITFNPSGSDEVTRLKQKAAAFIDECKAQLDEVVQHTPGSGEGSALAIEQSELFCLAMREAEGAAMWAVKAATKRPHV